MTCELLAPAGSLDKLKIAIHYGADAVYFGGKEFSLRAKAGNLNRREIEEAVSYSRRHGVRTYVTVNIFARESDLSAIREFLEFLNDTAPDALIISDPGIIRMARKHAPGLPIHLSTQANTTNHESCLFWYEQGIRRINLARELSMQEIRQIRQKTSMELEMFVHGALCISYSGRCMLSLYLTGRDANRGNCAHPCRYAYAVQEEKRPGEYFPVEEDARGLYIFNSKDLCLIGRLPELIDTGIDSLKIEGRMKGIFYLASVVRAYRTALDAAMHGEYDDGLVQKLYVELDHVSSRQYTENFLNGIPGRETMRYQGPAVQQPFIPAAVVIEGGKTPTVKANHVIRPGDRLEYMNRDISETHFTVKRITALDSGQPLEKTIGGEIVNMECDHQVLFEPWALIRKRQSVH